MKEYNKEIGNYGEALTCTYLIKNNHTILFRNFHCKTGEIDIISKKNNVLVFTEVKSRYNRLYGYAFESVDYKKQAKIKQIAKYYIYINNLYKYNIRFDVCEIYFNYFDNSFKINYINNAFN